MMLKPQRFSAEEMLERFRGIRKEMVAQGIDALVTMNQANIRYCTGFRGEPHILFLTLEDATLYTSFRTLSWAEKQTVDVRSHVDLSTLSKPLDDIVNKLNGRVVTMGIDESTSHVSFFGLEKQFSPHRLRSSSVIESIRRVKSASEIALMKDSQCINEEIFNTVLPRIRVGMSEREVQGMILTEIAKREEVDGYSFTPIVAAGGNAWEIHHLPDHTMIQRDDMLLIDLGVIYQGYASDMTRTVCMGNATEQMREVYSTVLQAQRVAISNMRPGAYSHDIDQAAREVISQAGHGRSFTHGLGHSIGLETHDPGLNLSPFSANEELRAGMVFTVEPGIYIEDGFGVRTEDIVVVTEDGHENITQQAGDLIELNL